MSLQLLPGGLDSDSPSAWTTNSPTPSGRSSPERARGDPSAERPRQDLAPFVQGQNRILHELAGLADGQLATTSTLESLRASLDALTADVRNGARATLPHGPAIGAKEQATPLEERQRSKGSAEVPSAHVATPLRSVARPADGPDQPVAPAAPALARAATEPVGPPSSAAPVLTLFVPDVPAATGQEDQVSCRSRRSSNASSSASVLFSRQKSPSVDDVRNSLDPGRPPPIKGRRRAPSKISIESSALDGPDSQPVATGGSGGKLVPLSSRGNSGRLMPPSPAASARSKASPSGHSAAPSAQPSYLSSALSSSRPGSPHAVPHRASRLLRKLSSDRLSQLRTAKESAYKESGIALSLVRSPRFEALSLIAVSLNAVWLAVDTELNSDKQLVDSAWPFLVVENMFCIFFVVEWIIRLSAFRSCKTAVQDGWMLFDTLIVIFMVLEAWVMPIVLLALDDSESEDLRMMQMLRLARLLRIGRLLRSVPEVLYMLRGIFAATHSVGCTFGMLFSTVYVFSIAFTQMGSGTRFGSTYFKNIPESMYTLMLDGVFMSSGKDVMDLIRKESVVGFLMFAAFVLITHLTILNLLIGVLCEVVSEVSAEEKEKSERDFVREKVDQVLRAVGRDQEEKREMKISKEEFLELLQNEEAMEMLEGAGVDLLVLLDFADYFFQSDKLGHQFDKKLGFDDFIGTVLKLRSGGAAGLRDVLELRKFVRDETRHLQVSLARIEDKLMGGNSPQSALGT